MASSLSGGASFFACIVRDRDCVSFTIVSAGVTIEFLIACCSKLKVSVNIKAPVSLTFLMMR